MRNLSANAAMTYQNTFVTAVTACGHVGVANLVYRLTTRPRLSQLLRRAALAPAKRINTTHDHMTIKPVGIKVTDMMSGDFDPDALFGG